MPARRWTDLSPWERRAELAKVHPDLTEDFLIADGLAVPELAVQIEAQESKEDELMIVLRYFGDERHPQPEERGALMPLVWGLGESDEAIAARMRRSPPWGRLPRLEGDMPTADAAKPKGSVEPDLSGRPMPARDVLEALRLYAKGESIRSVERETDLKYKRALRVSSWHESGAVRWDLRQQKPVVAPGFELVALGRNLRLVRIGPA